MHTQNIMKHAFSLPRFSPRIFNFSGGPDGPEGEKRATVEYNPCVSLFPIFDFLIGEEKEEETEAERERVGIKVHFKSIFFKKKDERNS